MGFRILKFTLFIFLRGRGGGGGGGSSYFLGYWLFTGIFFFFFFFEGGGWGGTFKTDFLGGLIKNLGILWCIVRIGVRTFYSADLIVSFI